MLDDISVGLPLMVALFFEAEPPTFKPMRHKLIFILILVPLLDALGTARETARDKVAEIVNKIQRADYAGDRTTLQKCYDELTPFLENAEIASHVRYWRGFDLWRSAINGFNESIDTSELEKLFAAAVNEFKGALEKDSNFVDAKVGMISCLGYMAFIHRNEPDKMQPLVAQVMVLVDEAKAAAPDNPRLIWVLGPIIRRNPPEHGGGLDGAIANYKRGLEICSKLKPNTDVLDPSWGKPELMMSLAFGSLNKNPPDTTEAERYARSALDIVPDWHYVRDILLPQILTTKMTTKKS